MIKQTKAYRAALAKLADAIAQQNPVAVLYSLRAGEVTSALTDVVARRHPDFAAAMDAEVDAHFQRRKQAGIENAAPCGQHGDDE